METPQEYYKYHGPMTAGAAGLGSLPRDVGKLCEIVQGVLIHRDIAPFLYERKLTESEYDDGNLRGIAPMLERIGAISGDQLTNARHIGHRLPCVCRHFTLMLVAILREQGVPARARCGFGAYFTPGRFEDHWVAEYWSAAGKRWILVDAQLDAVQRKAFKVGFNTLDVPRDQFIIAGDAWQMCRAGKIDPECFGLTHVPNLRGLWFIAGDLVRDLAALNKMELLPWDAWGMMTGPDGNLTEESKTFLDNVAALTMGGDATFAEVRKLYENDERLRAPNTVFNVLRNRPESIAT
ncbi:MAG TPA: transglutaminase-like domain-containing protein [Candidatus Binataceae bacterium]|nr:transglutaminase-like domain-containing protein [Candidatus Binataceae bacterium]